MTGKSKTTCHCEAAPQRCRGNPHPLWCAPKRQIFQRRNGLPHQSADWFAMTDENPMRCKMDIFVLKDEFVVSKLKEEFKPEILIKVDENSSVNNVNMQ